MKMPDPPSWPQWDEPVSPSAGEPQTQRRPRPRTVNPFVLLPVLGLLVLAAGMGFIAQRVHVMAMGYQLRELQEELARVQEEHRRLQVEVVRARTPQRIEALARTRLQMVDPGRPATVVLTPGAAAETAGLPAPVQLEPTLVQRMAAVGDWLLARFTVAAEAGARDR